METTLKVMKKPVNYSRYHTDHTSGKACFVVTKRKIIEQRGCVCESCGRAAPREGQVELHHILPICFGGTNDDSNLQLLCRFCHRTRTTHDKRIMNSVKRLGLVTTSSFEWTLYVSKEYLLAFFKQANELMSAADLCRKSWDAPDYTGTGKDQYTEVFLTDEEKLKLEKMELRK